MKDSNVENILSDDFGGHSTSSTWRIFEPEQSGGGSQWKKPEKVSTGKGYWLIQAVKENAFFSTGKGEISIEPNKEGGRKKVYGIIRSKKK